MNSGKNFYKSYINKKTKVKNKKEKIISNEDDSEKNSENNNLLNKKKKRDEEENEQDKIEINQNMYNQYNIYQRLYVSPIEMQIQQINNQNTNYPELYQNIYYINNPYEFIADQRDVGYNSFEQEKMIDLKGSINNMYNRGIVNNIIGAFFIEECKNYIKPIDIEEKIVNDKKINEEKKLPISKGEEKQEKKEENLNNKDKEKNKENNQENEINENNTAKESRLKKPILIW